jgi:spermidine synthase
MKLAKTRDSKELPEMKVLLRTETRFNDIMVIQNGQFRDLWFVRNNEFFLQSRIDWENPQSLVLVYSEMTLAHLLFQPEPKRVLVIGLGGSVIPNFYRKYFPSAWIDAVDIDGKVIDAAKKYFFLRESSQLKVHEGDGRVFVQSKIGKEKYDFIVLDAFKSGSIPYHLKTAEFYKELQSILAPGGVVSSNLYGKSNGLKPRDSVTFSNTFKQVYFFEDSEEVATVLHATDHETRWTREDMARSVGNVTAQIPFDMKEVAAMYRPGKYELPSAGVFCDDFSRADLLSAVERNNENIFVERPYPIKSGG